MNLSGRDEEDVARFEGDRRLTFDGNREATLLNVTEDVAGMSVSGFMGPRSKLYVEHHTFVARETTEVLSCQNGAFGAGLLGTQNKNARDERNSHKRGWDEL
jgi:hypothetical protein